MLRSRHVRRISIFRRQPARIGGGRIVLQNRVVKRKNVFTTWFDHALYAVSNGAACFREADCVYSQEVKRGKLFRATESVPRH